MDRGESQDEKMAGEPVSRTSQDVQAGMVGEDEDVQDEPWFGFASTKRPVLNTNKTNKYIWYIFPLIQHITRV